MMSLAVFVSSAFDSHGLLKLLLQLGVIGCIAYLITTFIPMPAVAKTVIQVIVAVAMIVIAANYFGLM